MSRRYLVAKFLGAAEEFAYELLQHRRQTAAKNATWNLSEGVKSAMGKFSDSWNKQLTTTMYLAGAAMAPCLNSKAAAEDKTAVERLVVRLIPRPSSQKVMTGDVVAVRSPLHPDDEQNVMVRRVAALEGAEMASENEEDEGFMIPKGHCWVLADNPDLRPPEVIDSRTFGFIPMESIIGRVIYSAYSATEHGPVLNNTLSVASDRPIFEQEVDPEQLFPSGSKDGDSDK